MSWNCESLATCDRAQRRRKFAFLERAARDADVVCLQELRCERIAFDRAARRFEADFHIFASAGIREQAGGVCTLVRKSAFRSATFVAHVVVRGRALVVDVKLPRSSFSFLNLHSFGFDDADSARVHRAITACLTGSVDAVGVVAGDFHIPLESDPRSGMLAPVPKDRASRSLQRALDVGVEVIHPAATRFSAATASVSRLDRFALSTPRSRWVTCQAEVQVPSPPDVVASRSLSDHAPVFLHLRMDKRGRGSSSMLWEPPARTEVFNKILAANIIASRLDDWDHDPVERWRYHKWVIAESLGTAPRPRGTCGHR